MTTLHRRVAEPGVERPLISTTVSITLGAQALSGLLLRPRAAQAFVICAHAASTESVAEPERALGRHLADQGFATLLLGLHTPKEDAAAVALDVPELAGRLMHGARWLNTTGSSPPLPLGYLGVGNAAAAALVATAVEPAQVCAVVARACDPRRAGLSVMLAKAPALYLVEASRPAERVAALAACRNAQHARVEDVRSGDGEEGATAPSLSAAWFCRWLAPEASGLWR